MTSAYRLTGNASLVEHNTFRVPAHAELLVEVNDPQALSGLLRLPELCDRPLLILGEGSNMLFTRDFAGAVVIVATHGMRVLEQDATGARIRAAAGEHWNDLVRWSLARGLCGLENLSLIPGSVGAAPIQNIGAYGAELADNLIAVEAYDRERGETARMNRDQCGFSYRQSLFKQNPERWIITGVELQLQQHAPLRLDYSGVREELSAMSITQPTATDVSDAVCRLRRRKLPDPAVIGNVGSFFKNPVVAAEQAEAMQHEHAKLTVFPAAQGYRKLSAAWLIEHCGWKGFRDGDAGVSEKHALVLVNYGNATGAELWALAQRIMDSVQQKFGIRLEPEPRII
ncbi:MAG TPA: UDP-N-acetylmuramate dehydrogenase [Gammaproteobacteria bacterium]|nr:UDP-N-acetylmuramate dehydrogenase [Gammaproteobacteria bacterium]